MLNLFCVVVFLTSMIKWRGGTSALSIHVFCYILNLFSVVVFHRSMIKWRGGTSSLSICALCYMLNFFGVAVFHRCMVNWIRGALVYVYSAICLNLCAVVVSIDLWSIGEGGIGMCAFCYVKLIWCSGIPYIYG